MTWLRSTGARGKHGRGADPPAPILQAHVDPSNSPACSRSTASISICAPGEVHVLFGENGAGKSTLISLRRRRALGRPTGASSSAGKPIELQSVHQARALGISAVFQEFSLVPQLTVEENLFLGAELTNHGLLDKRAMHRRRARSSSASAFR